MSARSLAVTGLGMVSSLGHDVVSSCAAARAGILRARELDEFSVLDEASGELVPVVGHVVRGIPEGYVGVGRLVRLAGAALSDLLGRTGMQPAEWSRTALLLALSNGYYAEAFRRRLSAPARSPADRPPADEVSQELQEARNAIRSALVPRLNRALGLRVEERLTRFYWSGSTGLIEASEEASRLLERQETDRCILGGVDSLIDAEMLRAFAALGVLKTAQKPMGFMPGEAAAFVMIETTDAARRRGSRVDALLQSPALKNEPVHRLAEDPPLGVALAGAIAETLAGLEDRGEGASLVLGGLNGDAWRAREWGYAQMRLPVFLALKPLLNPAESFGETGAAAGTLAVCQGVRTLARGSRRASGLLVWLSSEHGTKGALYLRSTSDGAS